jgi:single-stranded-DNA-specific exonuclease
VEALEQVKEHLLEFGGHPAAAGLTIEREQILPFREALNRVAHDRIDPKELKPMLELDGELPLACLTEELMRDLEMLAPFGVGNPAPVFSSEDARLSEQMRKGEFDQRGVRWQVQDPGGRTFGLLQPRNEGWERNDLRRLIPGPIRIAYSPGRRVGEDGAPMELRLHDVKRQRTTAPV